jgi:pre-mRNA-splicing factor SYF2/beta-D-xylosidase 4
VQSSTLLKNIQATLPLKADKLKSVAVIGPNSDLSKGISGYYGGNNCDNKYWDMVDAVKQYVDGTVTAKGVPSVSSTDISQIPAAVAMAKAADAVVLVVGCDLSCGREGHDADTISLSSAQQKLIDSVAEAAAKPVTVVILTHIPLDLTAVLANPKVGAVVHAGQPSVQTLGVGDVLFGKASPAGRVIQTVYPASYADEISIFDFNMRPGPSAWPRPDCPAPYKDCKMGTNPGRTHRFYTGKAVVPFGYGLSYTNFTYKVVDAPQHFSLGGLQRLLQTSGDHMPMNRHALAYTVSVTNTGDMDADDVVLGFVTPPGAGKAGVPLQSLFGFERVHVKAGETVKVTIPSELSEFQQVDAEGKRYPLAGEYLVKFGVPAPGMGYAETRVQASLDDAVVI